MNLSIIVPILDEAPVMEPLLEHLRSLVAQGAEVLLVDGGSQDAGPALAAAAGFRVIPSERGRARQMNAGAVRAGGEILLFLHADTRLPAAALDGVRAALTGESCWGRFDVIIEGRAPMLRVVAWLMNRRSHITGIATGDQALFVTRRAFEAVGGYPDQPLMEDIEISKRLLGLSRPACLPEKVSTSGRRWESRGVWSTILLMWRLRWAYWRGVPASRLARDYR